MSRAVATVITFARNEEGQDLLEYCLLISLIAIAAMVAVRSVGDTMNAMWWRRIADAF